MAYGEPMRVVVRRSHPSSAGMKIILRLLAGMAVATLSACQLQSVSTVQLEMHQALVNHTGLSPVEFHKALRIACSPPREWDPLPLDSNVIYSHQQWRSPDRHVGMGVAYMHTPMPVSPQT